MNRKSITKSIIVLGFLSIFLLIFAGCITSTNPVTGKKEVSVDPNALAKIEQPVEGAITLGAVASTFLPWLTPFVTLAGGIVTVYRILKPQLIEAQSEAKMYNTIASSSVLGIEEFKKAFPAEWDKLMAKLEEVKSKLVKPEDYLKIENIIRGLRGLPAKE